MHLHMVLDNLLPCTTMIHLILPEPPYHYLLMFRLSLVELNECVYGFGLNLWNYFIIYSFWINFNELTNYLKIALSWSHRICIYLTHIPTSVLFVDLCKFWKFQFSTEQKYLIWRYDEPLLYANTMIDDHYALN